MSVSATCAHLPAWCWEQQMLKYVCQNKDTAISVVFITASSSLCDELNCGRAYAPKTVEAKCKVNTLTLVVIKVAKQWIRDSTLFRLFAMLLTANSQLMLVVFPLFTEWITCSKPCHCQHCQGNAIWNFNRAGLVLELDVIELGIVLFLFPTLWCSVCFVWAKFYWTALMLLLNWPSPFQTSHLWNEDLMEMKWELISK